MALSQTYFSRPGKSSSETLKILKGGYLSLLHSHEAIKGKKAKISELNKLSEKSSKEKPIKHTVIEDLLKITKKRRKKPTINLSSSFKVQSRSEYENKNVRLIQSNKESTPSPGHYYLNYSQIEREPPVTRLNKSLSHEPKKSKQFDHSFQLYNEEPIQKKKFPGIPFDKQSNRVFHGKDTPIPNDGRFVQSNLLPKICSKYKNYSTPDLSKCIPRNCDLFKVPEYTPSYSPNKEFVLPKLAPAYTFTPLVKLTRHNSSKADHEKSTACVSVQEKSNNETPTVLPKHKKTQSSISVYNVNYSTYKQNKPEEKSFKSTSESFELESYTSSY